MTPRPLVYHRLFDEVEITAADLFTYGERYAGYPSAYPVPLNSAGDYVAITLSPKSDIRDVAIYLDGDDRAIPLIGSGVFVPSTGWRKLQVSTWYPTAWVTETVAEAGTNVSTLPSGLLVCPQKLVLRLWREIPPRVDFLPSTLNPITGLLTFSDAGAATMMFHVPGAQAVGVGASNDELACAVASTVDVYLRAPESTPGINISASPASIDSDTLTLPTAAEQSFEFVKINPLGCNNLSLRFEAAQAARIRFWVWVELGSAR